MKNRLIATIDTITQFGLKANLDSPNKIELLEKNLVEIYNLYFQTEYVFDEANYPEFNNLEVSYIRENVISNFPDFGWYKITNDLTNFDHIDAFLTGDAIDDLSDIIIDLIEVKWRIENNSLDDGLWYFKLSFQIHTKQHTLNLLNYIAQV